MVQMEKLCQFISQFSSFIITTHKNCDGDGLGAGFALYHGLQQLGKTVFFRTLEMPEKRYNFLDKEGIIKPYYSDSLPIKGSTAVLALDTNDSRMLGPFYNILKDQGLKVAFIDHHPFLHTDKSDCFFVDTSLSSTGELVYNLLKKLNITFNESIATALYTSIVFDTEFFRYIKSSPKPFSICSELVSYIQEPERIYENLFKNLTKKNLGFFTCFDKVEYHNCNSIGILYLSKEDFKRYDSNTRQAYDMVNTLMNLSSMEIIALILEKGDNSFKLSLRSRKKSILKVAESFEGGGHHLAAGAYINNQSLQDIKKKTLKQLLEVAG